MILDFPGLLVEMWGPFHWGPLFDLFASPFCQNEEWHRDRKAIGSSFQQCVWRAITKAAIRPAQMGKPEVRAWDRASNECWVQAKRKFRKRRAGGKRIMVFEPLGRGLDGEMGCFSRHQLVPSRAIHPSGEESLLEQALPYFKTEKPGPWKISSFDSSPISQDDLWFPRCKIQFEGKDRHHAFAWNLPKPNLFHTFLGKKSNVSMNFPSGKPHGSWTGARILRISQWSCGLARRKSWCAPSGYSCCSSLWSSRPKMTMVWNAWSWLICEREGKGQDWSNIDGSI